MGKCTQVLVLNLLEYGKIFFENSRILYLENSGYSNLLGLQSLNLGLLEDLHLFNKVEENSLEQLEIATSQT